jgi:S1-C subfamily serine protease
MTSADGTGTQDEQDDLDDLREVDTLMTRLAGRAGRVLAGVLAVVLAIPVGGWILDELAFDALGRAVEAEVEDPAVTDAVLLVTSVDCAGRVSTGTAFAVAIGGNAVVVTNRHVVAGARATSVRPLDGGAARPVLEHRLASGADVAVLELEDDVVPPPLPTGTPVVVGDEVRTLGFPRARPATTAGSVSEASGGRLELDLIVDPGASGSPVVDAEGRVVGQVFARTDDGRGVATALDALVAAVAEAQPAPDC